ncbi:DUF3991 and toprim domain-containing protein [Peribacillus muralis]|uniref:DUF3991 and TOPRIM domain-containing protein n=1 Tax=Peribacillus muralis TaxID=264697 RepID=UPI001F4ED290|nr:DUF3991 and TOPRIM domain-containing protein [Peribacillus muralis]MCK1995443.1 DUF3991 and toprim domain-containing protein [Peribacillus muralis]MCK2016026.1 DUF3991 and toprim domain-containing protein [Peribacillus muralis]
MKATDENKENLFVSAEEKERANKVNILDYLLSIGEPLKSEGNNFYRHKDHDSLVINSRKNYFSWNSRNVSGNAVTYLMNVYNTSFQYAVKKINDDFGNQNFSTFSVPEPTYPNTFNYDVKEVSNTDNVFKYLVHERKIVPDLVQAFIEADLIKEDSYKNVVFKWKENGELIGANLQGTREIPEEKRLHADRPYFKKVLPTTKEATNSGFSITRGYPEKLYFFEAPIDLLSYLSLNRTKLMNCRLVSMDGLKQQTFIQTVKNSLKVLREHGRDIESITLCVDNDSAGKDFIDKLQKYEFRRKDGRDISIDSDIPDRPKGQTKWDWNNELKSQVTDSLKKKPEASLDL